MARFANLNLYPVSLPTARGGTRLFRPGEFATQQWFSRFQGDGQLKEVPDDYTPSRRAKPSRTPMKMKVPTFGRAPARKARSMKGGPCVTSCQTGCQAGCEQVCEQSKQQVVVRKNCTQVGNTYYCKYCDWTTTKESQVQKHVVAYHPEEVKGAGEDGGSASADSSGEPRASGVTASRSPADKSAVPRQAPSPSGSDDDEGNQWWYRKDGELLCKTCEADGHGWRATFRDAMVRHCKKYHEMPDGEAAAEEPPAEVQLKEPGPGEPQVVETGVPDPLRDKNADEVKKIIEAARDEDHKVLKENGLDPAKPWKCGDCGRAFTTKNGLRTHKRYCARKRAKA